MTTYNPTITGTHSTSTTNDTSVTPFAEVTISDLNPGGTEAISIDLSGTGGTLTVGNDPNGYLRANSDGSYTLENMVSYDPATITAELDALVFTPSSSGTTTFLINDASYTWNSATSSWNLNGSLNDKSTTVINSTTVIDNVAPTITGTHSTSTTNDTPVNPFTGVTITDPNVGATDTLYITGFDEGILSGNGLQNDSIEYYLTGTAAQITSELDTLTFTPAVGISGSVTTTTFILWDQSSAYGALVSDFKHYSDRH